MPIKFSVAKGRKVMVGSIDDLKYLVTWSKSLCELTIDDKLKALEKFEDLRVEDVIELWS